MKTQHKLNRRRWIACAGSGLVLTTCLPSLPSFGQPIREEEKKLKFLSTDPRNGEPDLGQLVKSWITPVQHFYVRSHAPNPEIDPSNFRLKIEGKVRQPIELSLSQLAKFKRKSTTATMTCAGNRRIEFNEEKKVGGVQWGSGAIGNANWSGVSLADVLKSCEPSLDAKHVWFEGLDQIKRKEGIIPFGASIPIEKAMINEGPGVVLLCDQMNGASLTPDHGFPLRTVVPGYIGARSVKWIGKIVVSDRPAPNHYVSNAYKIVKNQNAIDWNEAGPIYRFVINAAVCTPASGSRVPAGKLDVSGYALPSGLAGTRIEFVKLSADGGKTWVDANVQNASTDFCWSLWSAQLNVNQSSTEILLKAQDTSGGFMPNRVPWNAKGYLQNSWFRSKIIVDG